MKRSDGEEINEQTKKKAGGNGLLEEVTPVIAALMVAICGMRRIGVIGCFVPQ